MGKDGYIYGYNLNKTVDTAVKCLLSEIPNMIKTVEKKAYKMNEGSTMKHIDTFVIEKRTLEENIEVFTFLIRQLPVEWQELVRQRCFTCKRLSKAEFYRQFCYEDDSENDEIEVEKYFKILKWRYADYLGFPVCHDMKKSEIRSSR